jgi:UDP-N-acetyl-D-glucosamine dehydrogenase
MEILQKIQNNNAVVGIIGLGYVGLPLAVTFAETGVKVVGFDKSQAKVDKINRGENYIKDVDDELLRSVVIHNLFKATTDFSEIKNCDALLICVPTPLDVFKKPDMSYIETSCIDIGKYMKKGVFICLESTT